MDTGFDVQFVQWVLSQGVGVAIAGLMFWFYRKDANRWLDMQKEQSEIWKLYSREQSDLWKGQNEMAMNVMTGVTRALTELTTEIRNIRVNNR